MRFSRRVFLGSVATLALQPVPSGFARHPDRPAMLPGDRFSILIETVQEESDTSGRRTVDQRIARYRGDVESVAPQGMILVWTPVGRIDPPLRGRPSGALGLLGRPIAFATDQSGRPVEIRDEDEWLALAEAASADEGRGASEREVLAAAAEVLRNQRAFAAGLLLAEAGLVGEGQALDRSATGPDIRQVTLPGSDDQWPIDVTYTTRVTDPGPPTATIETDGAYRPVEVTDRMLRRMGIEPATAVATMTVAETRIFSIDTMTGWTRSVATTRTATLAEQDGLRACVERQVVTVQRR